MTWVFMTMLAAFSQAWRNALQSQLSAHLSVAAVTLARFLLASPIALGYLFTLYAVNTEDFSYPNLGAIKFIIGAAACQILATGLMVLLFKQHNYAVGAGLAKSEAIFAAILGTLFFGSALSLVGWVGVLIGGIAVLLLSDFSIKQLQWRTACLGLLSGTAFAVTSLWVREASLASLLPFPFGAAWILVSVICFQCLILCVYLSLSEPSTWKTIWHHHKSVAAVGVTSCIGSIGWFSAMSLQHVAYVKTLGQLEILFMLAIAHFWLMKPIQRKQVIGLCLIALASALVLLAEFRLAPN